MNGKRRTLRLVVVGLLLVILFKSLSACTSIVPAASTVDTADTQAEVSTAVAATVVAHAEVEKAVAATLDAYLAGGLPEAGVQATPLSQAAAQPTPTATPLPTDTPAAPEPTNTPAPTATAAPAAAKPVIRAEANTNCRQGPSTNYIIDGYLLQGVTSQVYGRNSAYNWWYIANPTRDGQFCWVWTGSTEVEGDVSGLPVVTPTALPKTAKSYSSDYWYGGWYSGGWCGGGACGNCCVPKQKVVCKVKNCNKNWVYCQCKVVYTCKKTACDPWKCGSWSGWQPGPPNCWDLCGNDGRCWQKCQKAADNSGWCKDPNYCGW